MPAAGLLLAKSSDEGHRRCDRRPGVCLALGAPGQDTLASHSQCGTGKLADCPIAEALGFCAQYAS